MLEFMARKRAKVSRKIKFVIFACSFASIAAALRRLSDCGLTQAEFYEIFEFLLYLVLSAV